jgi:hypothetical protein
LAAAGVGAANDETRSRKPCRSRRFSGISSDGQASRRPPLVSSSTRELCERAFARMAPASVEGWLSCLDHVQELLLAEDGEQLRLSEVEVELVLGVSQCPSGLFELVQRPLVPGVRRRCGGLHHPSFPIPSSPGAQDRIEPVWTVVSFGCHPTRETLAHIEAAFEVER